VRAVKSYQGNNGGPDFLAFEENDVIEILDSHTELEGWYQVDTYVRYMVNICQFNFRTVIAHYDFSCNIIYYLRLFRFREEC